VACRKKFFRARPLECFDSMAGGFIEITDAKGAHPSVGIQVNGSGLFSNRLRMSGLARSGQAANDNQSRAGDWFHETVISDIEMELTEYFRTDGPALSDP
jgi:hypothetical protein